MLFMALSTLSCSGKSGENGADNEQAKAVADAVDEQASADEMTPAGEPSLPYVIDFYATWCGPCKQLSPILEKMEEKYHEKIIFERVDVDENEEMAAKYGIQSIPTLVFVDGYGREQNRVVGLISEAVLDSLLIEHKRGY